MDAPRSDKDAPRSEKDAPRSEAIAAARAAIARGDLVRAYDFAGQALSLAPGPDAGYWQVLALARMGDTDAALARYDALGLAAAPGIDPPALAARLLKDRAFAAEQGASAAILAAAHAYAAVFAATHDPYPGINAAGLSMMAGETATAQNIAAQILALLPATDANFYAAATRAEALLILGHEADAEAALTAGLALPDADAGARATTRKQLDRLARLAGLDSHARLRALLTPPAIAFWCGHMFRADAAAESAIAAHTHTLITRHGIGAGYGALAAGADIVIAETFARLGLETHIVLPFSADAFRAVSVAPAGASWLRRFDAALAAATSVRIATTVPDLGDPHALNHGSRVAMGLARLRARQLGGQSHQIAVWDGLPARGPAGTAIDVAAWQTNGTPSLVIPPGTLDRNFDRAARKPADAGPVRATHAIVFADIVGFSRLGETDFPIFWREIMARIAAALDTAGDRIASRNSWGDAVHAVITHAPTAARLMLALQADLATVTLGTGPAGLRVGIHHGTIYADTDPITRRPNFYGTEVNRAARIEPITPPGAVYVTEAFAAVLAMDAPHEFDCFYVGQVPLAKAYGTFPMYRLTHRSGEAAFPAKQG